MNVFANRRQFVKTAAAVCLLPRLRRRRCWCGMKAVKPLFKISLAEWSLHRTLGAGQLDNLQFPGFAKSEFGIEAVEYVNIFFADKAQDHQYLTELKARGDDIGVKHVLIMVDREGQLGDPDENRRQQTVDNHKKWVEAAKFLGCHSIRVNAQSQGSYDEQRDRAADGLRRLAEFGADYRIGVIVENHGGLSSSGKWLTEVIRQVDHPNCGTLPDFGNFLIRRGRNGEPDEWYDRYQGVEEMMPFAKAVSAKSHVFDENGNEAEIDFYRMMRIVLAAGYHGHVGVEWEGSNPGEVEGIRLTQQLLERVRDDLSAEA